VALSRENILALIAARAGLHALVLGRLGTDWPLGPWPRLLTRLRQMSYPAETAQPGRFCGGLYRDLVPASSPTVT
jgi:hypothetical protein